MGLGWPPIRPEEYLFTSDGGALQTEVQAGANGALRSRFAAMNASGALGFAGSVTDETDARREGFFIRKTAGTKWPMSSASTSRSPLPGGWR